MSRQNFYKKHSQIEDFIQERTPYIKQERLCEGVSQLLKGFILSYLPMSLVFNFICYANFN